MRVKRDGSAGQKRKQSLTWRLHLHSHAFLFFFQEVKKRKGKGRETAVQEEETKDTNRLSPLPFHLSDIIQTMITVRQVNTKLMMWKGSQISLPLL